MANENPPSELQTPAKRAVRPAAAAPDSADHVSIRITKLGHGQVSQGRHDPVEGDLKFSAGDMATASLETALALEARGFAEIQ
jgi:hypothetical protein